MDIILLDYYLRLFAIIANFYPYLLPENVRDFLKTSILRDLNPEYELEALRLFNEYYQQYSVIKKSPDSEENFKILLQTVQEIDNTIPRKQKFQILLRLLLFEKLLLRNYSNQGSFFLKLINPVIENFSISLSEYQNCKGFISGKFYQVQDLHRMLLVSDSKNYQLDIPFLQRKNFPGQLFFLFIESANTILYIYKGSHQLTFNSQIIFPNNVYFFSKGGSIKGEHFEPVYYNQILRKFEVRQKVDLNLHVRDLEFRFKNSTNGIHKLSFELESEQLIGIIGRSGVGKSTLINLLIGKRLPQQGSVTINGVDLHSQSEKLDGIIGYVSQDDLLIEELSVFKNLFLNAQLCFGDLSSEALHEKVNNLLVDLDLYEVRHLKVGSPLNRSISGGQRKKLNIALELIREPWILFADEPTSGLSSSDSEEIMQLLSEQTSKGRIVVVNIHQPSSDIFKLFDKIIVLDKEGYPVYFGNPLDAIPYFNDFYQRISVAADSCSVCENINPEAIFKILEEKKTNEFSEYTRERKTSPAEWHQHFLSKIKKEKEENSTVPIPDIRFNKPEYLKQFVIFSKRNLLTKLANLQYISLALLISPLLAIVLSLLCRYNNISESSDYVFAYNENIPSYLFMSVIVALFVGLIMSAEEIIRDRKILLRESYLKLSRISYINSKVAYVISIGALQTLLYVLIGDAILGIKGLSFQFWLILFSTSCFASLTGLLISSLFTSVIAIYIMVPLIIVPQMLLSGVVVNYDKLNNHVSSNEYVPFVGDLMASRWAYEALIVTQFSKNNFQRYYFDVEKKESNIKFNLLFVIPELKKSVVTLQKNPNQTHELAFLNYELLQLKNENLDLTNSSSNIQLTKLENKLDNLNQTLSDQLNQLGRQKDSITAVLVSRLGSTENYLDFKNTYYNGSVSDLVLKRKELVSYAKAESRIIRQMEPVYQIPGSENGRAQFLSASKILHGITIDVLIFNLAAIWLMTIINYIGLLIFSIFKKRQKE